MTTINLASSILSQAVATFNTTSLLIEGLSSLYGSGSDLSATTDLGGTVSGNQLSASFGFGNPDVVGIVDSPVFQGPSITL